MAIPQTAVAAQADPLQLEAKIPLGNVAGRIDHMAFDAARNRLFVAELGNNSVGVVDINARKVIHRISDLKEPQGVAYLASRDLIYIANGGDGVMRIYQDRTFRPPRSFRLAETPTTSASIPPPTGSSSDTARVRLRSSIPQEGPKSRISR